MYFIREDGVYKFDPSYIKEAHSWCLTETVKALAMGKNVVVANTFSQIWEMKPYIDAAGIFGAPLTVIHMTEEHGSIHEVPDFAIEKMRERWEPFTGEVTFP